MIFFSKSRKDLQVPGSDVVGRGAGTTLKKTVVSWSR